LIIIIKINFHKLNRGFTDLQRTSRLLQSRVYSMYIQIDSIICDKQTMIKLYIAHIVEWSQYNRKHIFFLGKITYLQKLMAIAPLNKPSWSIVFCSNKLVDLLLRGKYLLWIILNPTWKMKKSCLLSSNFYDGPHTILKQRRLHYVTISPVHIII